MNKKLIMTVAALLAFTTLAGCNINAGGNGGKNSSSQVDTSCTITLDLNYEGAPAATTISVEKGGYADAPANPERNGYYFDGWYTTPEDGEDRFEFLSTPIDSDLTLYAYWTAAYTVTFYLNAPNQEQSVYETQTIRAGSLAEAPANPKLSGYAFKGWYNTAACEADDEFSFTRRINSNSAAYAKWEEPDWSVVKDAIDSYFGLVSSVYGVEVPQFPNANYEFKEYSDCFLVSGPEKCLAEYLPILSAAGWTVDAENNKASNEYVNLEFTESDEKGFTMYVILKGTGASSEFNPTLYYVATQQNYVSFPESVLSMFNNFEDYKVTLNTDNSDPAALLSMFLPAKTDESKTDQEYYNEKLAAVKAALAAAGYDLGSFSSGGAYVVDPAQLVMNQFYDYDETSPLEIKFLSYSYLGVSGAGVSFNKIVPALVANADAKTAEYNKGAWVPTATLDVDLSPLAADYAVNGTNFVVQYDFFKTTVETNIIGVKNDQGINALVDAVAESIENDPEWEIQLNQEATTYYEFVYAYHFVTDENGKKAVDAKMYFDVFKGEDDADQRMAALGCGKMFKIYFAPASSEWAKEDLAAWFEVEALTGDETALPDYTGEFSVCEAGASFYGDYYHIYLLGTVDSEALAYVTSLTEVANGFSAIAEETDADKGEYAFLSASGFFEVYANIYQGALDLYVNAYVEQDVAFDAAGLTKLNAVLDERNGFSFPATLTDTFTATYTGVEFYSFYNVRYELGHSVVDFVSNVAENGDATAVNADANAIRAYLEANGFERKTSANGEYFVDENKNEIHVDVVAPDATDEDAPATFVIEVTIFASPAGSATSYTAEKVANDMNANFVAAGYSFSVKYNDQTGAYSLAVNFGASTDESESNLKSAANTLASFLPSYMTKTMGLYCDPNNGGYDVFRDGTVTYYLQYQTPDGKVTATIISYIYDGKTIAQISIK